MIKNCATLLGFLFIIVSQSLSKEYSAFFRNLDTKDGLSENHINCILQDDQGFIWIGTNGGLNRFDGYEFKQFLFNPDENSTLRTNIIQCMAEDQIGNIWLGTVDRGVYRFNKNTEKFSFIDISTNHPDSDLSNFVTYIVTDSKNRIWFTDNWGLNLVIPGKKKDEYDSYRFPVDEAIKKGEANDKPTNLKTDQFDRIWLTTTNGIYLVVEDSIKIQASYLKHFPKISTIGILDADTFHDKMVFSSVTGVIMAEVNKNYELVFRKKVCDDVLKRIEIDKNGNLWGAYRSGLEFFKYDKKRQVYQKAFTYRADLLDAASLSENQITTIVEDNTGILWVGTYLSGISILDPYRKKFNYYHNLVRTGTHENNQIRSLFEDSKGNIWIGTSGRDIIIKPSETKNSKPHKFIQHKLDFSGKGNFTLINSFAEGQINGKAHIWVGTGYPFKIGIIPLEEDLEKDFEIKQIESFPASVFKILVDSGGVVWVCTYDNGLYRLYPNQKGLNYWDNISYKPDGTGLYSHIVRNIYEDFDGNMWVATSSGLNFIPKAEKYKENPKILGFRNSESDLNSLSHNYILPITQTQDRTIWVGTFGGGVNKLQQMPDGTFNVSRITTSNGLPNNMIKGLLKDNRGNVWISSNRGLSCYNIEAGEIRNFDVNDGLQDFEFIDLSCMKTRDGEFFFGGVKGFNSFYPGDIVENEQKAIPVFTELQILNETIEINEKFNGREVLKKTISATKNITVFHGENSFLIKFSALHYASPAKNSFRYMLEGFDKEWITTTGDNRIAKYTNLDAGIYTFKLIASNNDKYWNETPAILNITVMPPWWKSKLAFVVYGILFVIAMLFFRKYSLITYRKKKALLMEKLEKQKLEELTQSKLDFFTYISHEIRTPLTLIKGPVQNLLQNYKTINQDKKLKLYEIIKTNSDRIQALITQLFDFRETELRKMKLSVQQFDIVKYTNDLIEHYSELIQQKEISIHYRAEESSGLAWFDLDVYGKIINNLLSNAIKYTKKDGEITIDLAINRATNKAMIKVSDTGIGIAKDHLPYIFDMFYKTNQMPNTLATGIGLSFVKSLVQLHHGNISCKSELNIGTSFHFTLPIDEDAYSSEEISINTFKPSQELQPAETTQSESSEIKRIRKAKGDEVTLLIVEDNIDIITYIADNLPTKYKVIKAENGQEGFEQALEKAPDIIVSDIMMPIMDGIEFCTKIKEHTETSHIPVILLSAKGEEKDFVKGYTTGADGYIGKPFGMDVLVSNIESVVKNRLVLKNTFKQQINVVPGEIATTNQDEILLENLIANVEENFANTNYKTEDLAKNVGMSLSCLNVKLKGITGLTIGTFIRTLRLKRAAQLIEKSDLTISEITYEVGFNDLKYFRNCFKKEFGRSPSEYRAKSKN